MNAAADSLTARELTARLLEMQVYRLNHVEQLLLGLATLALAGWGFLHAWPTRPLKKSTRPWTATRSLFAMLFSCVVGSAFSALYMGRMGLNMMLIRLEAQLDPPVKPFLSFMHNVGEWGVAFIFAIPALLIPIMSVASLLLTFAGVVSETEGRHPRLIVLFGVMLVLCAVAVCYSTLRSVGMVFQMALSARPYP